MNFKYFILENVTYLKIRSENYKTTMDLDKKFVAAVDVIKNLPSDGPFETSNEMKLQFYAYYKQATIGPCNTARPGFWDLVGR